MNDAAGEQRVEEAEITPERLAEIKHRLKEWSPTGWYTGDVIGLLKSHEWMEARLRAVEAERKREVAAHLANERELLADAQRLAVELQEVKEDRDGWMNTLRLKEDEYERLTAERDEWADRHSLEVNRATNVIAENVRLTDEVARLRACVSDLQSGLYVNCVYCGHRYGPGETTPVSMADALKAHVEQCPEHPMSALKARERALVEALRPLAQKSISSLWTMDERDSIRAALTPPPPRQEDRVSATKEGDQ